MRIFFSVGEPSGDLHASRLLREMQARRPDLECVGYGGPLMQAAGCRILFQLTDLAVMGVWRVLPLLWKFISLVRRARQVLREDRPDAVVLVDFPGFNWWIARAAKKLGIPVFYYMPPQLWAWGPWRIARVRKWVDHVLCGMAFEQKWYVERGIAAELVGHPFFDEVTERQLDRAFLEEQQRRGANFRRTVALLPGSRNQEVHRNFAAQLEVAHRLQRRVGTVRFLVASYRDSQQAMCEAILARSGHDLAIEFHVGKLSEIVELSDACLMVSGSVSLELLARTTPTVVVYRLSWFTRRILKLLFTCRYFSLPNLMAGQALMPEFDPCGRLETDVDNMTDVLQEWLTNPYEHARRVHQLRQLRDEVAKPGATVRAAESILLRLHALPAAAARRYAA